MTDPLATPPDASSSMPTQHASVWEDFIDIFYAPRAVFERRRSSGFGMPLLVFLLLMTALSYASRPVIQPMLDAEFARGAARVMAKNPAITMEQMQEGRVFAEKFQVIAVPFSMLMAVFGTGLVLWLVGKFADATESVRAALMITTYAFFPRVAEQALNLVQGYVFNPDDFVGRLQFTLGVGRFLDPVTTSPLLQAVLGRVDVITIWVTILLAIGLSTVAHISMRRAVVVAVIVWVIGALPGVFGALQIS